MATATSPPILIWQPEGGFPGGPVSNPPVYSQADVTPLVQGQQYVDVVFGSIQTSVDWVLVTCEVENTSDLAPLNIWPGIITSRTTAGFRVWLNGVPDSNGYYLHWAVSGVNILPVPATLYFFTGPTSGAFGVDKTFTVKLPPSTTLAAPLTVTPDDGGSGGTFSPTSVTLSSGTGTATFIYTAADYGAVTISVTNSGTLVDPAPIVFTSIAPVYTFSGPSTGDVGVASTNFTVQLPGDAVLAVPTTITPSAGGGGGTFTPTTVLLIAGVPVHFTYTPASGGAKTISVTNDGGLANPASISYLATAPFDPSSIAGLKLWLKADAIAGPPTDGTLLSAWNDSSSNGYNLSNGGGTERPTFKTAIVNGKPVIRFNGTANRLFNGATNALISVPYTVFVVGNSTTLNDCRFIHSTPNAVLFGLDATTGVFEFYAGGAGFVSGSADNHGAFHCFEALFLGAGSTGYVDGSLVATGDSGSNQLNFIGVMTDGTSNTVHSAGDVAEILVYNSTLSLPDRVNLRLYLKNKYNLP